LREPQDLPREAVTEVQAGAEKEEGVRKGA
jgi:hypothetical protein